jgi:hypothetical protein
VKGLNQSRQPMPGDRLAAHRALLARHGCALRWAVEPWAIMKRTLFSLLPCLLLAGCSTQLPPATRASGDPDANAFAIYLTAERPALGSTNLAQIRLISPPVISDADLVAADLTNGVIRLRPEALKRLPEPSVQGTFFVVVADGERLFLGAFWTHLSSWGPVANAMIIADRAPGQDYLYLEWYDPARLGGGSGWGGPWSDQRLQRCLGKLHKFGYVKTL